MNILKKQGVAWGIAFAMILAAIGIGLAKAPTSNAPLTPDSGVSQPGAAEEQFYVYDDANVLSGSEERNLGRLNEDLYSSMGVVVACVTTNYGRDDLYSFALDYAERIRLDQYDFIVVLDISGDNYWLVQGAGLVDLFTDDDCSDYAWEYLEDDFARGDYGDALLSLVKGLSQWYEAHYTG